MIKISLAILLNNNMRQRINQLIPLDQTTENSFRDVTNAFTDL